MKQPESTPEHADNEKIFEEPEMEEAINVRADPVAEPPSHDVFERAAAGGEQAVAEDQIGERQDHDRAKQQRSKQPAHAVSQERPGPPRLAGRGRGDAGRQEERRHRETVHPEDEGVEADAAGGVVGDPERESKRGRGVGERGVIEEHDEGGRHSKHLESVAQLRRTTPSSSPHGRALSRTPGRSSGSRILHDGCSIHGSPIPGLYPSSNSTLISAILGESSFESADLVGRQHSLSSLRSSESASSSERKFDEFGSHAGRRS